MMGKLRNVAAEKDRAYGGVSNYVNTDPASLLSGEQQAALRRIKGAPTSTYWAYGRAWRSSSSRCAANYERDDSSQSADGPAHQIFQRSVAADREGGAMSALPDGFVLEGAPPPPSLPSGFMLEQPAET